MIVQRIYRLVAYHGFMTKAYGYLRVSGRGQVHGDGFPRQRLAIKGYAAQHDIKIVQVFEEKGITGTKDLEDRPALSALMLALQANGVTVILVEALHRLARDLMIQESILADFKRQGFTIISVTEPDLCSDDPSRKLMRQVMGAFFEYEKTMIVIKLRGARQRMKARTGRCEGSKPYGHYPGEQAVLDRITASHAEGQPFLRIAANLNADGLKPRRGTRWHAWSVNKILSR
jgi:DNA invertase Pin-like site-specific DNA recombinase